MPTPQTQDRIHKVQNLNIVSLCTAVPPPPPFTYSTFKILGTFCIRADSNFELKFFICPLSFVTKKNGCITCSFNTRVTCLVTAALITELFVS
jgi:hypothetical protein